MKLHVLILGVLVPALSLFADDWVYDNGYVSDGTWKFAATVSGNEITFGRIQTDVIPSVVTPVDFSKPVRSADGQTEYTIVSLDDMLGYLNEWQGKYIEVAAQYRNLLGEVTLPTASGLRTIGSRAFYKAVNLTGNFTIPDTVTTIGPGAFHGTTGIVFNTAASFAGVKSVGSSAFQDTNLSGAINLPVITEAGKCCFANCKLTSITCGPNLTTVKGAWHSGWFYGTKTLESVTLDPSSTVSFSGGADFGQCSKLKEVDLSCAKILTTRDGANVCNYPTFEYCTSLTKVTLGKKLTTLDRYVFFNATSLAEVHFYGPPPANLGTPVFDGAASGKVLTSYVHLDKDDPDYDYDTAKAAWDALTAGGSILESGSTWSSAKVGSVYTQRPLVLYVPDDPGELGHWIYDDRGAEPVVSNNLWTFKAALSGRQVAVRDCIGWPKEISEIDFSKPLTDHLGRVRSFYELSPKFSTAQDSAIAGAQYVGKVVLPQEGIITIGSFAFGGCVNCTNVVNCIPDSVTTLEAGAFYKVPFAPGKGSVRLYGLSTINRNVFNAGFDRYNYVEDLTFGPKLKTVDSGWRCAPFFNCKYLTNVVFDAAMSGGVMKCSVNGPLNGCTRLTKLDIRGFPKLSFPADKNAINADTGIRELILSAAPSECSYTYFSGTALTNIIFLGVPPTSFDGKYLANISNTHKVYTTVLWENRFKTNSVGKCWMDYLAGPELRKRGSTWAAEYVKDNIDLSYRPLIAPDAKNGFVLIVR